MVKKLSSADIIAEAKQLIDDRKRNMCRSCHKQKKLVQSGFCQECWTERFEAKKLANKDKRLIDNGYIRVYDEDNKLVYEHVVVMEKMLGRKMTEREAVIWRNGNRQDNDPSNLLLGYKMVAIEDLVCMTCGNHNVAIISSPSYEPEPEQAS